jgi:2,5-didehydrogluconate reductase
MKKITLNNGVEMPPLGYGVFQVSPEECERCVSDAISVGYRSIDTAQIYQNEEGVGNAVKKSGIDRKEFFLTTKIWSSNFGYEKAKLSIDKSLEKLQTDYIDLLLIHQPINDYYGAYRAMEEAYKEGKIRAIGVSNFYADRYLDLAHFVEVKPAVNQVETHVFHQQRELQEIMKKHDTKLMSWGPLAEGKNDFFNNPVLKKIGEKYGKSVAQVALRYLFENDVILIPKSANKDRMAQNIDIFDFQLSVEDREIISQMDERKPLIFDHRNPEMIEFLLSIV